MYIIILIIMANINAEHFAYKLYQPREGHLLSVSTALELPNTIRQFAMLCHIMFGICL